MRGWAPGHCCPVRLAGLGMKVDQFCRWGENKTQKAATELSRFFLNVTETSPEPPQPGALLPGEPEGTGRKMSPQSLAGVSSGAHPRSGLPPHPSLFKL